MTNPFIKNSPSIFGNISLSSMTQTWDFGKPNLTFNSRTPFQMAFSPSDPSGEPPKVLNNSEILAKAGRRALGGGISGALAMIIQVVSLMPMRTTMNYSYRHHTDGIVDAFKILYKQGGATRFWQGLPFALMQGPLSRFGDTAANVGILELVEHYEGTKDLPIPVKTAFASGTAATWRIFLMPIDAMKTMMQVEGREGLTKLRAKVKINGPSAMYHGALGAYSATLAGHWPWFTTFNSLDAYLPKAPPNAPGMELSRNALMGFCSSIVSDSVSNSIRVLKTYRQTYPEAITYPNAARQIIAQDGIQGLFFRGLKARLLSNAMQGLLFSVLWKYFQKKLNAET